MNSHVCHVCYGLAIGIFVEMHTQFGTLVPIAMRSKATEQESWDDWCSEYLNYLCTSNILST